MVALLVTEIKSVGIRAPLAAEEGTTASSEGAMQHIPAAAEAEDLILFLHVRTCDSYRPRSTQGKHRAHSTQAQWLFHRRKVFLFST